MDKKVVRDLREKELKAMMMSRMGDFNGAMALMLDCFDDLDDAIHFFARRERGTLLDLAPGEKLDRWGTTVRFSQRLDRDPELRAEMHRHPRYLTALLAHEAQGLPIIGFLGQVREVRFVEEEPGLHWLLLPECHRGCKSLDGGLQAARSHEFLPGVRPASGSGERLLRTADLVGYAAGAYSCRRRLRGAFSGHEPLLPQ